MKELSNKEIKRYNYTKVKDYVENEFAYLSHLGTKLYCLLPPDAGRQISFLDKVDGTITSGSKTDDILKRKIYLKEKLKKN